ncbi:hypothetical protein VTL71DRAFT_9251 [Oculimacula yallundae]|uniref:Uncharacterized protein n=1 Tax=Oculimacula yallundae TaxID=86028 RepID=A0ABR4BSJ5_9HELO
MVPVESEPIQAFQWAVENLSPAEVIRCSQVRDSFHRFLQRGTTSQLRQLQLTAQDLPHPSAILDSEDHFTSEAHNGKFATPASAKNGYPRGLKRRQNSDQPYTYRPGSASKKCRTTNEFLSKTEKTATASNTWHEGSTESSSHMPVSSDTFSPASTNSDSDSTASCPAILRHNSFSHTYVPPPNVTSDGEDITSHYDALSNAADFFKARLGARIKRLHYLVRAVQGFLEAPTLEPDFAKGIWCSRTAIFTKPQLADPNARLRNLYDGHRRIKQAREQYSYAARFCYIYLEHDLEELAKSQALVLSQGRGRMTAAFEVQASIISTSVDVVKAERKAGRGYLQLLLEGGPGFILSLGCNVSTIWERKLSVSDISLIIEYLKNQTPELYQNIKSKDKMATEALLEGFVAYGWTKGEILSSTSQLFGVLKQYVNMEDIINEDIVEGQSLDLSGLTPTDSLGDILTPGMFESHMDSLDVPIPASCFAAGEKDLCSQSRYLTCPELANEIAEMSDAELESWMSFAVMDDNQKVETMDAQHEIDLSNWDGALDKLNLAFTDPSIISDSFATYI